MSESINYGSINGHSVGRALKEAMRRVIGTIEALRLAFEVTQKDGYSGNLDDLFTNADVAGQDIYVKTIQRCFPGYGIIGEEANLKIDPEPGFDIYVTIDPLDGTKAFVRGQSHGVGSMVALIRGGEVICAYVGDINSREIYGYRPDSDTVYRISRFETGTKMTFSNPMVRGKKNYMLLRDPPVLYSCEAAKLVRRVFPTSYLVDGGSIGIWMARLWKREVSAVLLRSGWQTPWDLAPIVGISLKLGYVFMRPDDNGGWMQYDPAITTEKYEIDFDTLVIHKDDLWILN